MATTTMIVPCETIGEQELTISYKAHKGFKGTQFEPAEVETVTVYWAKLGGPDGFDVTDSIPEFYMNEEIIPHCLDDHNGYAQAAAEEKAERMREAFREAA